MLLFPSIVSAVVGESKNTDFASIVDPLIIVKFVPLVPFCNLKLRLHAKPLSFLQMMSVLSKMISVMSGLS